jgi:hypothetical protein
MILKIISGGQSGADRAALDAAIARGIGHGGWLPAGRKTEDGPLSSKYVMKEMTSASYPARTAKNVEEADATLIVSHGPLTGGSALTARIAAEQHKPCLHIDLDRLSHLSAVQLIKRWLREHRPEVLNIAGPRAGSDSSIYADVYALVLGFL